jgi:hypothetical protein
MASEGDSYVIYVVGVVCSRLSPNDRRRVEKVLPTWMTRDRDRMLAAMFSNGIEPFSPAHNALTQICYDGPIMPINPCWTRSGGSE